MKSKKKRRPLGRRSFVLKKTSFQQDIALNQLPFAHKSAAAPVAATLQYLAENGVKLAKNFIAAPPWWAWRSRGRR